MRLVIISDTHGFHPGMKIPDGDVLVHCGDICRGFGHYREMANFMEWMAEQPHNHKVFIAGNHDSPAQDSPQIIQRYANDLALEYLQDSEVVIDGVKFYGSPWQIEYHNMAFNLPRFSEELVTKWSRIPQDTDVLITHGPPKGILDKIRRTGRPGGCSDLRHHVLKRVKPKLHCFGHIHEGHGIEEHGGVTFINAACCTRMTFQYTPEGETMGMGIRNPIVYDLDAA